MSPPSFRCTGRVVPSVPTRALMPVKPALPPRTIANLNDKILTEIFMLFD